MRFTSRQTGERGQDGIFVPYGPDELTKRKHVGEVLSLEMMLNDNSINENADDSEQLELDLGILKEGER